MTVGMETDFSRSEKMTGGSVSVEHFPVVLILIRPALFLPLLGPSSELISEIRR